MFTVIFEIAEESKMTLTCVLLVTNIKLYPAAGYFCAKTKKWRETTNRTVSKCDLKKKNQNIQHLWSFSMLMCRKNLQGAQ